MTDLRYAVIAEGLFTEGLMGHTLTLAAVGAVAFMVLDGIWLGMLMKSFDRDQLAPIVHLADGGIAPNWPAAFVVYVLLGTGIALFVIPRASTISSAAGYAPCLALLSTASTTSPTTRRSASGRSSWCWSTWAWGMAASAACAAVVRVAAR